MSDLKAEMSAILKYYKANFDIFTKLVAGKAYVDYLEEQIEKD